MLFLLFKTFNTGRPPGSVESSFHCAIFKPILFIFVYDYITRKFATLLTKINAFQ